MNPFGKQDLDEDGFTYKGFTGLRNNVPNSRFAMGDLEAASNVDLDDTGRASRRNGYVTQIDPSACHSIGPSGHSRCFYVSGTTLYEILGDYTTVPLVTGLTPNKLVNYFVSKDRVYWSNGVEKGCIEKSGNRSWGLAVPPPISGVAIGGNLRTGRTDITTARYQFVMTYLRNDDQESGAVRASYVNVPDNGGILFSNLPVSADPTVNRKAIYITEPNGQKLYRAIVLPNATTSVAYTNRGNMTLQLVTQFMGPPPAADIISLQGGSILLGIDDKIYYSEPYWFELFDTRKHLLFASKVKIICSFDNGSHVGTDLLHVWLAGDTPDKFEWNTRANYGAIEGTLDMVDVDASMFGKTDMAGPLGLWATKEGIVRGMPDGTLENLTRAKFLYPIQERGASTLRLEGGVNQFVLVMQGVETAPKSNILP